MRQELNTLYITVNKVLYTTSSNDKYQKTKTIWSSISSMMIHTTKHTNSRFKLKTRKVLVP